jgi:hypothetical protein
MDLSAVGKGCPDILVAWGGKMLLMEIKGPKGKLEASQTAFLSTWPGPAVVVRSVAEALAATGVSVATGPRCPAGAGAPAARK